MSWLVWLIRALFLVKEIVSRTGVVHFRRYRLIATPWFRVCLHQILASDEDSDPHDHPFDFTTIILKGSYSEQLHKCPTWGAPTTKTYSAGSVLRRDHLDAHRLTLKSPVVWTLVFMGKNRYPWGYQTSTGWVEHRAYRTQKNSHFGVDSPA